MITVIIRDVDNEGGDDNDHDEIMRKCGSL
jgi:hypothetical protein